MRALALDFERRSLGWSEVAEPSFYEAHDVLFRVHEVGVCGTDRALAAFELGKPPRGERHLVLGHEALGQVIAVGHGVETLNCGDWVVPTVRRACHPPCSSCGGGRRDLCTSGQYTERGIFGLHGYFTERAVDHEEDLLRIPPELVDSAILIEPLSVAEKAIARAIEVHPGEPRRALVLGAGPIGILSAMVLRVRGYDVRVHSIEPVNHPRVALLAMQDIRYEAALSTEPADIVVEATGSAEAAMAALASMPPLAVMVLLGAPDATGPMPFMRMIVNNQALVGSVNADPQSFAAAAADLARFDRRVLGALISRSRFADLESSLIGPPLAAAKRVHLLEEDSRQ